MLPRTAIKKADNDCAEEYECAECRKCLFRPVDIIFVLDGSASVSSENWVKMKQFVTDFLIHAKDAFKPAGSTSAAITIENRGMRAAVVAFGGTNALETLFTFTSLEEDGDDYASLRLFRQLSATCLASSNEADCIAISECRWIYLVVEGFSACTMQGLVECRLYDSAACDGMIACRAGLCGAGLPYCNEGDFLCLPYEPLNLVQAMGAALTTLDKPSGSTRTGEAIEEVTRIFETSPLEMSERNRLLNLVPSNARGGLVLLDGWTDIRDTSEGREWTEADQQRIVVLVSVSPRPFPVALLLYCWSMPTPVYAARIPNLNCHTCVLLLHGAPDHGRTAHQPGAAPTRHCRHARLAATPKQNNSQCGPPRDGHQRRKRPRPVHL